MSEAIYNLFAVALLACCAMCLFRIGRGPTAPDRMVAIDIMGILVVGFAVLLCILTGKDYLMNVAIAWALLSFIGTTALAKHLEGKGFDE
jgi:multicomponent Na+:H+ antiporter subunit F